MTDATLCLCSEAPVIETVRWTQTQLSPVHSLPLGRVLELLAAVEEHQAVERMLGLIRSTIEAGPALAIEYVLHGGVLKVRQVVSAALDGVPAGEVGQGADGSIADPAHGHLVALARGVPDDAMFGMRGPFEPSAVGPGRPPRKPALRERLSVLYGLTQNIVWAMHFFPSEPDTAFRHDALSVLPSCALLVREAHRIVSPAAVDPGERVDSAEVRLGVRAASLSRRERQI